MREEVRGTNSEGVLREVGKGGEVMIGDPRRVGNEGELHGGR